MKKILSLLGILGMIFCCCGRVKADPFPMFEELTPAVQFWVDVFTRYTTSQAIIFDADQPKRIYRIVQFPTEYSNRNLWGKERLEILNREREAVAAVLKKLGFKRYKTEELSFHELRIAHLFGAEIDTTTFRQAAERIRVQEGMRESFREGLIRSKCYLTAIRDILKSEGLPEKLAYLPHVESSFNPHAYSKYGAAGMWQITRSTGKRYLRIDEKVDERRDLYCSTVAAAKILKENYKALHGWPLAVTAYNHGRQGILRAVDTLGTRDLIRIIREYRSPKFGFASKNFYAEFLAAIRVAENPALYFGDQVLSPPIRTRPVDFPVSSNSEIDEQTTLELFENSR